MQLKHFTEAELTPDTWMARAGGRAVHVFNPCILRLSSEMSPAGLIMAYRVVLPDGSRHIAICGLRDDWSVRKDSIVALSDLLTYADAELADPKLHIRPADPRLVVLQGRLFVHFNSGSSPRPNCIYLVELDPSTLRPRALVRPVLRRGARRSVEKNWMFFEHGDDVYVIYALSPLTILRADLSAPEQVVCTDAFVHAWDSWPYEDTYGELRGGATPLCHDDQLLIVTHSVFRGEADKGRPEFEALCYVGSVLTLSNQPPFVPLLYSPHPVLELTAREQMIPHQPRLDTRVQEALYPCGAVAEPSGLTTSYGVNERYAAIRRITWHDLHEHMIPVVRHHPNRAGVWLSGSHADEDEQPIQRNSGNDRSRPDVPFAVAGSDDVSLRGFWWLPPLLNPRSPLRARRLVQGQFVHGNFGDMLVPHLLRRLMGLQLINQSEGPRFISLGSLIQTARDGDMIWGTGLNGGHSDMVHAPRHLHVKATRGPISREFLRRRGYDVSHANVMFDPAALLPHLFADEISELRGQVGDTTEDFIIIPHFSDDAVMRRLYPQHAAQIITVDTPFFKMVGRMLRASLVVSSSLHGLIVAEALGIPAVWHRPIMGEDELKFHDYYLGTDRYRIVRADTLLDALKASPMPLPVFDTAAMLATLPTFAELDACGLIHRPTPLPIGRLVPLSTTELDGALILDGWSAPEPHGVWSDGDSAELNFFIGHSKGDDLILELFLAGFVPPGGLPQQFSVADQANSLGTYELADQKSRVLRLALRDLTRSDGRISLRFSFPTAVAPASLGIGRDVRRISVALEAVRLRPTQRSLTRDAHLRIAVGERDFAATEHEGGSYVFDLPAVDGPVRIVSRTSSYTDRPNSQLGLTEYDRRLLGVTVECIVVTMDNQVMTIEASDRRLEQGWWPLERHEGRAWRWTNGAATLPLAPGASARIEILGVKPSFYVPLEPRVDPASALGPPLGR